MRFFYTFLRVEAHGTDVHVLLEKAVESTGWMLLGKQKPSKKDKDERLETEEGCRGILERELQYSDDMSRYVVNEMQKALAAIAAYKAQKTAH